MLRWVEASNSTVAMVEAWPVVTRLAMWLPNLVTETIDGRSLYAQHTWRVEGSLAKPTPVV
eukprot:2190608-Pyramimonas_sp.AAC.1